MKVIQLHQEEKQLIMLAVENNRQAQQQIYAKFSSKMLSVCRQYIKDIHHAEDVMITGFMKVFTNLKNFEHKGSFEGWIRRIMIYECIDFLRVKKNNFNHQDIDDVTLIHMDHLAQMTDETLENRKKHIPAAEVIIEEIKDEFISWTKQRKFAPTIHALKEKLNSIKDGELNVQRKKMANFDEEQAELISARIIQKITNHFANHLKDDTTLVDESIEWIEKIFQIETTSK